MSAVRVFLLTCRRPALLPRALASLRAQTFTDWVCELHNDAPEDDFPGRLLAEIGDPRITLHHHERNWGPVATFNHAFGGGPEPYIAILEDDNWWEPGFLAAAHTALESAPTVNVVWANLRIWREEADGTWTDTGRTIWKLPAASPPSSPTLFQWPEPLQFFDALHSNGAMLVRTSISKTALVPADLPFAIIEPARERLLPGGWLLLPQPLANFAVTCRTARSDDPVQWARAQLLVAASYLHAVRPEREEIAALWAVLRAQNPPATNLLFHLAFAGHRPWTLLRFARPADWFHFILGAARHPISLVRILRFISAHPTLWPVLLSAAADRTRETSTDTRPGFGLLRKELSAEPCLFPHDDHVRSL